MTQVFRKPIALFCLFTWALAMPGFGPVTRVLCLGPDGHVAIEQAHRGNTCDVDSDGCPGQTEPALSPDCTDVPLPSVAEAPTPRPGSAPLAQPSAAARVAADVSEPGPSIRLGRWFARPPQPGAMPLRSIILLL